MSEFNMRLLVNQNAPRSTSEGVWTELKGSKRGEACIIDFYTEMMLEGRGFQIKAGTVSIPLVGDQPLEDAKCEFAVGAPQGVTAIITMLDLSINLGTGTLHEYFLKSVDGTPTGTDFPPLPALVESNGVAAICKGYVAAAGGVTVAAETSTTTRRHWAGGNPVVVGAGHSFTSYHFEPRTPPTIANNANAYVQLAAITTGPSYFGSMDFIELLWTNVS